MSTVGTPVPTSGPSELNVTSKNEVEPRTTSDFAFSYILVPSFTLVIVVLLVTLVVALLKRKRKMERLRHNLMPFYNFAPGEEDDWETELLDSDGETRRDYHSISSCNSFPLVNR